MCPGNSGAIQCIHTRISSERNEHRLGELRSTRTLAVVRHHRAALITIIVLACAVFAKPTNGPPVTT